MKFLNLVKYYKSIRTANYIIQHLPEMKEGLLKGLDMVFIPKQIASQVVLAVALETSLVRDQ